MLFLLWTTLEHRRGVSVMDASALIGREGDRIGVGQAGSTADFNPVLSAKITDSITEANDWINPTSSTAIDEAMQRAENGI